MLWGISRFKVIKLYFNLESLSESARDLEFSLCHILVVWEQGSSVPYRLSGVLTPTGLHEFNLPEPQFS